MPRGGLREPKGGRPPKGTKVEVIKRLICQNCGRAVGKRGGHTCKPREPRPRPSFVPLGAGKLPSMPPDLQ